MYILVKKRGEVEEFVFAFKDKSKEQILLDLKNAVGWAEFRGDGYITVAGETYLLKEEKSPDKARLQEIFGTAEPAHVA